ncbi:hypothetical protein [Roseateles albus]|uniref:SMP-LTD domain-containing protein n=1 Tax=Roseateles albus TaxID=2987525 RepID=A0ABT5K9Q1_9BURK|nr:hypothetical protein [Roseateles albus]MDC8770500.1 hypothetical protein [Roseateles albus]
MRRLPVRRASLPAQQAPLASLLCEAVAGVLRAQAELDRDALSRVTQFVQTPQGGLSLPPLWYSLTQVDLSFEMAATVSKGNSQPSANVDTVRLDCRLLNPAMVSLFGHSASSGLKVALRLAPQAAEGLRPLDTPSS